ncbi:MAG: NDMA-dependent alcohol dehydrogenase [Actinomycetota bacterium]|nr:NDMA-dependent alcohol dehydrogenase [Actinomycetota bacterium]
MKTRAAVLRGINTEWSIEDIDLDPPKHGEVVVRIAGAGLCHSDEHLVTGDMLPDPSFAPMVFPMVGGHEAAGEVVEVGPEVRSLQAGDHVVLSFIPACGRCQPCAKGQQHLCDLGQFALTGRQISDMTSRHHDAEGKDLGLMCCVGTFAEHTVVNEASCIKIDPWIPLETAALLGCGVTTGWGSAVYAAGVTPGDTVVVVGLGGIGMNAVQGARIAGARNIVAVDEVEWKREAAETTFGATHTASSIEQAASIVNKVTWGANAEKAILTTGVATGDLIAPLLGLVAKGGRAVVTAVAPMSQGKVDLNLWDLTMNRKELVGCIFGNANPRRDIVRLLRLWEQGQLLLDELVTQRYPLERINDGYADLRAGKNLRGLISFSAA